MADIKMKSQSAALSTAASGTQDFTIAGFGTVVGAIFQWCGGTALGTSVLEFLPGIGFCDVTNQVQIGGFCNDNQSTGDNSRRLSNAEVITILDQSQNTQGKFGFNSFITNGVRLDIDEQATSAYLVAFTLIGTDNIANINCGIKDDLGTGTSGVAITGVGDEPDLLFIGTVGGNNVPPSTNVHNFFSFGCAINDGSETQRVSLVSSDDNLSAPASRTNGYIGNDSICGRSFNDALSWDAVLTSFDADGFTITPNVSTASAVIIYFAITFTIKPQIALFDMEWPTADNYSETNPGFQPTFGMISTVLGPSSRNSLNSSGYTYFNAVFDSSILRALNSSDQDNQTNTNSTSLMASTIRIRKPDSSGDDVVAGSVSFTSLGWDFTVTTNPASAGLGWGLAIGDNSSGPKIPVVMHHHLQHNLS